MNFAIVDDSSSDRSILKSHIRSYMSKRHLSVELSEFTSAETFLFVSRREKFDVVFLDIYMSGKSGMEAAQELFASDYCPKIIFLSSSTEFFRQSYAVRATYYLVKPIVLEEFRLAMRFLEILPQYQVPFLKVLQYNVDRTIYTEKILYIEVRNHKTIIHTDDEVIPLNISFQRLIEPLEQDERFLRCIRGVLVNMQHIIDIEKNAFLLDQDIQIPINIRNKKQITEKWRVYRYNHMEEV